MQEGHLHGWQGPFRVMYLNLIMAVRLLGTGNQTALDLVASLEGVVSTQVLLGVCR